MHAHTYTHTHTQTHTHTHPQPSWLNTLRCVWIMPGSQEEEASSPPQLALAQPGLVTTATYIILSVKDQYGIKMNFKIKKTTQLWKLKDKFCSRVGLQLSQVRLMVDDHGESPSVWVADSRSWSARAYEGPTEPITDNYTVGELGLEDGDLIASFFTDGLDGGAL